MTDLFVIGGGPAGLAAALAARRKGLTVTLADGARPPIDKACGEGLMPDALAALRQLGVALDSADGHIFRGVRFLDRGITFASAFPEAQRGAGLAAPYKTVTPQTEAPRGAPSCASFALGVRRTILHSRMVEAAAAAGVRMLWGAPVLAIRADGVSVAGEIVPARWIAGADGFHSRARRWAGLVAGRGLLEQQHPVGRRFGFRIHFSLAPWSDYMELHWGRGCQIYVTPVGPREVCVALISRNPRLRLDEALRQFPQLSARLAGAGHSASERGAVTANRRLPRVYRGKVALLGDASGSVDAITGEGLCLAFRQALALADSLAAGNLAHYQAAHRRLARRPTLISQWMLTMDRLTWLRRPAFRAMACEPRVFQSLLSFHLCVPDFC